MSRTPAVLFAIALAACGGSVDAPEPPPLVAPPDATSAPRPSESIHVACASRFVTCTPPPAGAICSLIPGSPIQAGPTDATCFECCE